MLNSDFTGTFSAQIDRLTGPWQRTGALLLNQFERMTDFQLQALHRYAQINARQLREALQVHDDESLQEFVASRRRTAEELSQCIVEDSRTLAEIGKEFAEQAQRVAEHNARSFADVTRTVIEQSRRQGEQAAAAGRESARRAS
jgi:phasin family protein